MAFPSCSQIRIRYLILNLFFTARTNRKISVALTGICTRVSMNVTLEGDVRLLRCAIVEAKIGLAIAR